MYDMVNIFEVFLPQLLRYPNPTDPLNGEAAALLMKEPKAYDIKVKGEFEYNCFRWLCEGQGRMQEMEKRVMRADMILHRIRRQVRHKRTGRRSRRAIRR